MTAGTEITAQPRFEGEIETRYLQKFADAVATLRTSCRIAIDDGDLIACGADMARVQATQATLPLADFESFEARTGETGFPGDWLQNSISVFEGKTVRLAVDEGGTAVGNGEDYLSHPAVDAGDLPAVPGTGKISGGQTASVTITGREFKRFIEKAEDCDETHAIEVTTTSAPEGVALLAWDEDGANVIQEEEFTEEDAKVLSIEEHGSSSYTNWYIAEIAEAITASPPVTIRFAEEWPLTVRYPLVGPWSGDERGFVEHHLAPRIPPEEGRTP